MQPYPPPVQVDGGFVGSPASLGACGTGLSAYTVPSLLDMQAWVIVPSHAQTAATESQCARTAS